MNGVNSNPSEFECWLDWFLDLDCSDMEDE